MNSIVLIVRKPQQDINCKTTIVIYIMQQARNIPIKIALIDMLCITTDGRTMGGVRGAFIIYLFICLLRPLYVACCYATRESIKLRRHLLASNWFLLLTSWARTPIWLKFFYRHYIVIDYKRTKVRDQDCAVWIFGPPNCNCLTDFWVDLLC